MSCICESVWCRFRICFTRYYYYYYLYIILCHVIMACYPDSFVFSSEVVKHTHTHTHTHIYIIIIMIKKRKKRVEYFMGRSTRACVYGSYYKVNVIYYDV